jgi:hypothetical protein
VEGWASKVVNLTICACVDIFSFLLTIHEGLSKQQKQAKLQ